MHGDFSRLTYTTAPLDTDRGFAAVLGLQGRLTLESDANENVAILTHFLRMLVTDLIGPAAGPVADAGFAVTANGNGSDLLVSGGRYYVGGLLVQTADTSYTKQASHDPKHAEKLPKTPMIAYLKVWERLVTAVEDPAIREVALGAGGPDTAARSKVAWEVVLAEMPDDDEPPDAPDTARELWNKLAEEITAAPTGRLRARAHTPADADELCALSPGSHFAGAENQLYRVEIHSGGEIPLTQDATGAGAKPPTFKWSRDNGSVVFPIERCTDEAVVVSTLGRDDRLALDVGDWVEVVDDRYTLAGRPATLRQVVEIHPDERLVTLDPPPDAGTGRDAALHPFLRRWDQDPEAKAMGVDKAIVADGAPDTWIALEDGVQVRFEAGTYRSGDYWTIPARVETGDVIWPADAVGSKYGAAAREPEGIRYYYAPLAYVFIGGQRHEDLRCLFSSLPCRAPSIVGNVAEIDADVREAAAPAPAPATRRRAAAKPKPR